MGFFVAMSKLHHALDQIVALVEPLGGGWLVKSLARTVCQRVPLEQLGGMLQGLARGVVETEDPAGELARWANA